MSAGDFKPPAPKTSPDRIVAIPFSTATSDQDGVPELGKTFNTPPVVGKTRADFRIEEFQRALAQHGRHVCWRKAMLCPCQSDITGQSRVNCPICDQSGVYYMNPVNLQALVLGVSHNTSLQEKFGIWIRGEASITVLPEFRLAFHDSIEMLDGLMVFNEVIRKNNRHGIRSKLPADHDSCRYRIVNVVRAMLLVDNGVVSLEEKTHFEITTDGWIRWLPAGKALVANDTQISIRYEYHPVFVVESHPHVLRDDVNGRKSPKGTATALPIQVVGRLDYLVDVNTPLPVTGG